MKKNQIVREARGVGEEENLMNAENLLIMRKNMAELKQHLAMAQRDKQKLEKDLHNLSIHY